MHRVRERFIPAHNPKATGSNPAPATKGRIQPLRRARASSFTGPTSNVSSNGPSGLEGRLPIAGGNSSAAAGSSKVAVFSTRCTSQRARKASGHSRMTPRWLFHLGFPCGGTSGCLAALIRYWLQRTSRLDRGRGQPMPGLSEILCEWRDLRVRDRESALIANRLHP